MKSLTRAELEKSLSQGKVAPLYFLYGPESYLRDAAAASISDAALSDTLIREFNQSTFDLLTQSPGDAMAAAEQLPMMSSRRVVKITNFAKLREAQEVPLISYLQRPADSSVVIFMGTEPDKRKSLTKALLDSCTVVEFQPLKDGEAKSWAKKRLRELKVAIDEHVLSDIIALVGTDVQTLNSELEKLAAAAVTTGRITWEMAEALLDRSRELSNFELGDQLIARNRKKAMETVHRLLEDGAPPVMLLGAIASNYHRLALAKEILTRGSRDDVFRTMPMPFFKRDAFISCLQRTDAARIAHGIQLIAAADLAIKTSVATPRLQLEMLVCELAA
jgi:DNA polymerase III subunit delta